MFLFLSPKFIVLALAKTTTNIHNLSFLLIFVLGGVLNLIKGKDVEIIKGGGKMLRKKENS
jgi:hypothetical protein